MLDARAPAQHSGKRFKVLLVLPSMSSCQKKYPHPSSTHNPTYIYCGTHIVLLEVLVALTACCIKVWNYLVMTSMITKAAPLKAWAGRPAVTVKIAMWISRSGMLLLYDIANFDG